MAIRDIIRAALFTPTENGWGLPLAFWEGPGVGKSFELREVPALCGLLAEILSPGERGEGALGCVPMPRPLTEKEQGWFTALGMEPPATCLDYPMPNWAIPMFREGRGVIVTDELTTTPPALQPALLGLMLEKRIAGVALPRGVRVLGAYNPPDTAANGYPLPKPVANRVGHVKWTIGGVQQHVDWTMATIAETEALQDVGSQGDISKAEVDPAAEEARVLKLWPHAAAKAAAAYASFITKKPNLLHAEPEPHDPTASGPWPSRRTWTYAVRALATSIVHKLSDDDRDTMIMGFVGEGAGSEFIAYLNNQELPDALDILDGKIDFNHEPGRDDITVAVLDACAAYVVPKNAENRDARARMLWKLLAKIVGDYDETDTKKSAAGSPGAGRKDLVVPTAVRLAAKGFLRIKESRPLLTRLNKTMKAAGYELKS
jgi:hypothetical protein